MDHIIHKTARGHHFETGRPVRFPYIRNTQKAPYLGSRFGQDIEPRGRYLLYQEVPTRTLPSGWESGHVAFENPLVIRHYDTNTWKRHLSQHFKAKGKRLTQKIRAAGHDGIVTAEHDDVKEIVDLRSSVVEGSTKLLADMLLGEACVMDLGDGEFSPNPNTLIRDGLRVPSNSTDREKMRIRNEQLNALLIEHQGKL